MLRHRTPSSPICLSEAVRKPFALSRVFLLSSGGKSIVLVKKKAPSRSGILLSMYVVLKARHTNPISTYVDIRATYVAQTYLPLVHNFYPYAEQQPNIGLFTKLYSFLFHPISSTPRIHIPIEAIAQAYIFITRTFFLGNRRL